MNHVTPPHAKRCECTGKSADGKWGVGPPTPFAQEIDCKEVRGETRARDRLQRTLMCLYSYCCGWMREIVNELPGFWDACCAANNWGTGSNLRFLSPVLILGQCSRRYLGRQDMAAVGGRSVSGQACSAYQALATVIAKCGSFPISTKSDKYLLDGVAPLSPRHFDINSTHFRADFKSNRS